MYNILNLLVPGSLGDWAQFKEYYVMPLKDGQKSHATVYEKCQVRWPPVDGIMFR